MPNWVNYEMKVVSDRKESIERFLRILQYRDFDDTGAGEGRYMERVSSAVLHDRKIDGPDGDGLYSAVILGTCAWSLETCMSEGPGRYARYADPKHHVFRDRYSGEALFANLSTNLRESCQELGLAVEGWCCDPNMCFQEHWTIRQYDIGAFDLGCNTRHWEMGYEDEATGVVYDTLGGWDEYGEFETNASLWRKEASK